MTRSTKLLSIILPMALVLSLGAASCDGPSQAEFDDLKNRHEALVTDITTFAADVHEWETATFHVVCDIVKNNPQAGYAQETLDYCPSGAGDGFEPKDPPEFGGDS